MPNTDGGIVRGVRGSGNRILDAFSTLTSSRTRTNATNFAYTPLWEDIESVVEEISYNGNNSFEDLSLLDFYNGVLILDKKIKVNDFIMPKKIASSKYRKCIQERNSYAFMIESDYAIDCDGNTEYFDLEYFMPIRPTQEMFDKMIKDMMELHGTHAFIFSMIENGVNLGLTSNIKCKLCGCTHSSDNKLMTSNREIYCKRCYDNNFAKCEHCTATFKKELINREGLCEKCSNRHYILSYHDWRRPRIKFYGGSDNGNRLFMGVESEVDGGGERNQNATKFMKIVNNDGDNFSYCMHDGSLSDGFEIITQPATLRYHTSIMDKYKEGFKCLIDMDYLAHDTATCGLHVHFNRSFYADNEELYISRLLLLSEKFWDKLVIFSRRNHRKLEQYAKKIDMDSKDYIRRTNKSNDHDYHYYSVNLANSYTIEFRMFRGTLNANTYLATLQLCQNMIKCAKSKTAEDIQRMEFEELITHKVCKQYWNSLKGKIGTEE